jgi:mannose-6-phosphate isomerase-like protein (cupin superfamily)
MTGWVGNIEEATKVNSYFREVLFTATHMQLVVMSLQPGEEIGLEMHDHVEQFIRIESGSATVTMGPSETEVAQAHDVDGDWAVIIPGGTWHNVINRGDRELKLYTIYAPPEHPHGTVHKTKADAIAAHAAHRR